MVTFLSTLVAADRVAAALIAGFPAGAWPAGLAGGVARRIEVFFLGRALISVGVLIDAGLHPLRAVVGVHIHAAWLGIAVHGNVVHAAALGGYAEGGLGQLGEGFVRLVLVVEGLLQH